MTRNPFQRKPDDMDIAIADLHVLMIRDQKDPEKYKQHVANLKELTAMKAQMRRNPVSLDSVVTGAVNLIGVGMIIFFERDGVMGSKAFTLLFKKSK